MNQNNGLSKGVKIVIISILSFLVFVLSILSVLLVLTPNTFIEPEEVDNTRTIMIYMAGTDLESNHGNASADLKGIKEYYNDPENYHILLYTGGTKIWHNSYISSQENSIYELTMNGFEKKETLTKKSMGLEDTLTEFLDYGYRNYEAGNYDLIMWDHGLGSLGSIYDENTKDFITSTLPFKYRRKFNITESSITIICREKQKFIIQLTNGLLILIISIWSVRISVMT